MSLSSFSFHRRSVTPVATAAITSPDATNLQLWYNADAIVGLSDNQTITSWPESSGNGHTLTCSSLNWRSNFVNGKSVVQASGSANAVDTLPPAAVYASSFTLHAAIRRNWSSSTVGDICVIGTSAGAGGRYWACIGNNAFNMRLQKDNTSSVGNSTTPLGFQTWAVVSVAYDNSTGGVTFYLNGTVVGTATNSTTFINTGSLWLLSERNAAEWWTGEMEEFLMYNAVQGSTALSNTITYLRQRIGV